MVNEPDTVPASRRDLITVLSHLNTIVVSLDRIGSSGGSDVNQLTIEFLQDWNIFRRLSECRTLLSDHFSRELGEDDMDELERELEHIPYWSMNTRTPPD